MATPQRHQIDPERTKANLFAIIDGELWRALHEVAASIEISKRSLIEAMIANAAGAKHPDGPRVAKAWAAYRKRTGQ